jgi:hypothetical protein
MTVKVVKGARKIEGTSFTEAEAKELARLLGLVAKDGGWWPTVECAHAADRATTIPAVEVAIMNPSWGEWSNSITTPPKILLYWYDGSDGAQSGFKPHWTLPGARMRLEEIEADAVRRVGQKEIGTSVEYLGPGNIFHEYKWAKGEHPDGGRPLSLYARCKATVCEVPGRLQFFPVNAIPQEDGPEGRHRRNLDAYFRRTLSQFFAGRK